MHDGGLLLVVRGPMGCNGRNQGVRQEFEGGTAAAVHREQSTMREEEQASDSEPK